MFQAHCTSCGKSSSVPAAGLQYPCQSCGRPVAAPSAPAVATAVADPASAAEAPPPVSPSVRAPAPLDAAPAPVAAPLAGGLVPPQAPGPIVADPLRRKSTSSDPRMKVARLASEESARRASKWLLTIAILVACFGVYQGVTLGKEAGTAKRTLLALHKPSDTIVLPDLNRTMKVSDIVAELDSAVRRVCVVQGVLAAAFLALSFWARRSPVPAAVTGLCLFLVIQVANAIFDPKTLLTGWVIKFLFVAGMIKAITSAIEEQKVRKAVREQRAREAVASATVRA